MLGVSEDVVDIVIFLSAWVLAHMPIGDKASVYGVLADLDSVILDSPSNSCGAFGVQDSNPLGVLFLPIIKNYFFSIF